MTPFGWRSRSHAAAAHGGPTAVLFGALLLVVAGCGTDGAKQFSGARAPTAEETFGACTFCHRDLAEHLTATGGHSSLSLKCEFCHADLRPGDAGPGHRAVPKCLDCHDAERTHHDPQIGAASECLVCHTPHGSPNLFLVQEQVTTPGGGSRDIVFTNLRGRADGSFASASHPGTGLCEVCHTQTAHYRSDGSGSEHFPFACFTCHPHAASFAPQ